MNKKTILLILLSGFLLILSFPKVDQSYLVWVALIPILYAIEGTRPYRTFLRGWLCGFVFYIGLIYWIVVVTTTYGKLPYPLGILVMLLLAGYLSIYVGLSFSISRWIEEKTSFRLPITLPFIWVTMEYLRSFLFTGFPWESLGYSQYQSLSLIQLADITGVYGISFFIVCVNTTLYLLFRSLSDKNIPYKQIAFTILVATIAVIYGRWRLAEIVTLTDASATIKAGLVQGNVDQGIKWNKAFRKQTITTHQQLSIQALQDSTRLIIWPESSTPFYFQSELDYQNIIFEIIHDKDAYLLLGSPSYEGLNGKYRNFNSAFLLSPSNEVIGKYDKVHLVPYGEYVPLKKFFPFIDKMVEGIGAFYAGRNTSLLNLPEAPFGVLICYEIIFPDLTRRFVKKGAQFLVNITNDAWFGKTSAPYQHISMAAFRAIENRRFVARAANTGISAFIDARGEIKSPSRLFTESLITGKISLLSISTFYTRYGDIFAQVSSFLSMIWLSIAILRKTKG